MRGKPSQSVMKGGRTWLSGRSLRLPWRDVASYLVLGAIGVGGAVLHMMVTRWGIGLSADSAVYIAGARGILQGRGYAFPYGGGVWEAITLWPPFYSMVLAGFGLLGIEPLEGARWLNSILLGGSTILIGLVLRQALGASRVVPLMGALLFLLIDDTLSAYGWAWSDGLSLFLGFAGLHMLARYLDGRRSSAFWASAVLVGLSSLSRYAGVAFTVTGVAVLATESRPGVTHRSRFKDLVAFSAPSCVLMMAWLLRNVQVSGSPIGPPVFAGPITAREWEALYRIVSHWLVPGRILPSLRTSLMILIGAIFLFLSGMAIVARPRRGRELDGGNPQVARMFLLFVPAYFLVILGTRTAFRYFNMAEDRYYVPLYAALVIVWLVDARWVYDHVKVVLERSGRPWIRKWGDIALGTAVGTAFGVLLVFHGVQAWKWGGESYSEGMGYANESWHKSQLVRYVRSSPLDAVVFSNAYDALYVLTGREVYPVPQESPSLDRGRSSQEDWDDMVALLRDRAGVVVFFRQATRRGLVSERTLVGEVAICPLVRASEGTVYEWCGGRRGKAKKEWNRAMDIGIRGLPVAEMEVGDASRLPAGDWRPSNGGRQWRRSLTLRVIFGSRHFPENKAIMKLLKKRKTLGQITEMHRSQPKRWIQAKKDQDRAFFMDPCSHLEERGFVVLSRSP